MSEKEKLNQELQEFFEDADEVCQSCGGALKPEKVNLEELENGKLYLMENVLAYICEECGEMWVPEPILKEFEKMMEVAKARHKGKPKPSPKRSKKS